MAFLKRVSARFAKVRYFRVIPPIKNNDVLLKDEMGDMAFWWPGPLAHFWPSAAVITIYV